MRVYLYLIGVISIKKKKKIVIQYHVSVWGFQNLAILMYPKKSIIVSGKKKKKSYAIDERNGREVGSRGWRHQVKNSR